ncbi:MAG: sugar phosphate isomerase/epimerase [Anaerolineaceae bacterium]|nr:sugar phosphate isomerase/epimerase [Anaerolineaceae bacterium]
MKFGANTFIWRSPFSTEKDLDLVDKTKELGFDLIEIAVEDPSLVDVNALMAKLEQTNMGVVICGAFGPGRNLSSLDEVERTNAKEYMYWMIDTAQKVGSEVVAGPMYSSVGKAHLTDPKDQETEWNLAVEGLKELCKYAQYRGVKLAFENLNRFETDMINVVDQGLVLIEEVGAPNLGFHLDTFHMHLEEKDSAAAIRKAGDRIFHFHAAENDRGVPGTGQVRWKEVFEALVNTGYDSAVVIESFTPEVKSIARAVCIWREISPDQDTIAREGLKFIKSFPGIA